jgi:hypothetical protein
MGAGLVHFGSGGKMAVGLLGGRGFGVMETGRHVVGMGVRFRWAFAH